MSIEGLRLFVFSDSSYHYYFQQIVNTNAPFESVGVSGTPDYEHLEIRSVEGEAPSRITTVFLAYMIQLNTAPSTPKADKTVMSYQLELSEEQRRTDWLAKARNVINILQGSGLAEEEVVLDWAELTYSPRLFIRKTPQDEYYVSTEEDREHMVSKTMVPAGPQVSVAIANIMSSYWRDWMKQADAKMTHH